MLSKDAGLPSGGGLQAISSMVLILAATSVLAGFAIDLAAGRWGAYIRSPIPGIFLPDLLLALGAAAAAVQLARIALLPRAALAVFLIAAAYLGLRGLDSLILRPVPERYLAIRDLAPFAYLSLVPLIALALRPVPLRTFLWVVRIATALHLAGFTLETLGLITPFGSPLLGAEFVRFFDYRGDLLGVAFGIGVLAWGRWPTAAAPLRTAQLLFFAVGLSLESRAAVLTLLFCVVFALWRERGGWPLRRIALWLAAGLAAGAILIAYLHPAPTAQPPKEQPRKEAQPQKEQPRQEPPEKVPPEADKPDLTLLPPAVQRQLEQSASGGGTLTARLLTWRQIVDALPRDNLWLLGGGLGSDILFRICAEGEGPTGPGLKAGGGWKRPKCHVDSNEAPTVLRDPHNWLLNLMLYHGIVGTLIFIAAVAVPLWRCRSAPAASLAAVAVGAFFVNGTFGVILSAPFGMLPIAVFLGWLLRMAAEDGRSAGPR